jgi:type II secretory pathway component PulF
MNNIFSSRFFVRFSTKERTFFAKRMSFLVTAGIPLVECLQLIRAQTKSIAKRQVYDTIIAEVSEGQYLATSLSKQAHLFGDFAVSLIRVGEESGILSQNFVYLAEELQKKEMLERKVLGALLYPLFITVATLGVTIMLTAYIFPKLMPIFTSLHVQLPLTTQILIAVSAYVRAWGVLTVCGMLASLIAFLWIRTARENVRTASDRVLLRTPLAGSVARAYNLANFCRTLGLLLRSGVTLTSALEIVSTTTINRVYRAASADLAHQVLRGESLSRGMSERADLYPDLLAHLIAIGEKTGNLVTTLAYLGELYEGEVDELTKSLSSAIEPVLMILMGLLVGVIAVSIIMPIYEITQHLQPA